MRPTLIRVAMPVATFVAWMGAGCQRSDSFLLVELAGSSTLQPSQFKIIVTDDAAAETKPLSIPAQPSGVIALPASFSVELARDLVGPIEVDVTAVDASGVAVASGSVSQMHIDVGGETIVTVPLTAVTGGGGTPSAPDGGGQ